STGEASVPTGPYISYQTTSTLDDDINDNHPDATSTTTGSLLPTGTPGNASMSVVSTESDSMTVLEGGHHTTTLINGTATSSSTPTPSSSPVVNTQPCNGYVEFCDRSYSNITNIVAHNSPFVRPGNIASNQALDLEDQLNDGIRTIQFQTHLINGTLYLCHTNCDLLNVGTLEDYLARVNRWMRKNPYEVITIFMGNFDLVNPANFSGPIERSGLMDLVWTPPKVPMGLDDWPTLASMILSNKRAIFTLDYGTNQTAFPWLMDQFSQVWETPFSPTHEDFPCTVQRPPGLPPKEIANRMYMANHNLNLRVDLGLTDAEILVPNMAYLVDTNGVSGYGSLGSMAENCTDKWGRPPNFLLVDYYNYGKPNGSVFEVAAQMNNVTYKGNCCGKSS
ncbi:PLC-like phosphodiesterase, partial [Aspergillus campestris IBT 28561]